mmetsp:Transcript_18760/g.43089  ORF Transcript_18760/g.43089 Transcript_18760/m.43089 type:complete len:210 (-) Transcript_18760:444-1073(-)
MLSQAKEQGSTCVDHGDAAKELRWDTTSYSRCCCGPFLVPCPEGNCLRRLRPVFAFRAENSQVGPGQDVICYQDLTGLVVTVSLREVQVGEQQIEGRVCVPTRYVDSHVVDLPLKHLKPKVAHFKYQLEPGGAKYPSLGQQHQHPDVLHIRTPVEVLQRVLRARREVLDGAVDRREGKHRNDRLSFVANADIFLDLLHVEGDPRSQIGV